MYTLILGQDNGKNFDQQNGHIFFLWNKIMVKYFSAHVTIVFFLFLARKMVIIYLAAMMMEILLDVGLVILF